MSSSSSDEKEIDFASKRVFPGRSNHLAFPPFAGGGVGLLGLLRSRSFLRRLVSALPSFTFFLASVLNSRERKVGRVGLRSLLFGKL